MLAAAGLVAFSPNGQLLVASFASGAIRETEDLGQTWRPVPGPWDVGGKIVALAVDNARDLYVAVLEGLGRTLALWHGHAGDFEEALGRGAVHHAWNFIAEDGIALALFGP